MARLVFPMLQVILGVFVLVMEARASPAEIIETFVPDAERAALLSRAMHMPQLMLSDEEFEWLQVLAEGWVPSLNGFMTEAQFLQSLHYEHLFIDGKPVLMPVPIVKACGAEEKVAAEGKEEVALVSRDGSIAAVMLKPEFYEHRKEERAGRTFGITHGDHPYISKILESGGWLVGGQVRVLANFKRGDGLDAYRLTPRQLQQRFADIGADAVFVFQLRNPIHNGHALLMTDTYQKLKSSGFKKPILWLSPLGGWTKDDDVPLDVRMEQHLAVIKGGIFGETEVVTSIFPSPMLYAGPREVQWHALARQHAGATHYIVGRDPAGMKHPGTNEDIYHAWHGQKMLQMSPGITTKLLPFTFASYDLTVGKMAFFDPARAKDFVSISGSKMRELARTGKTPPDGFMHPDGWTILTDYYAKLARSEL